MERTVVNSLKNAIGENVKIQGWVQTIRDQKKVQFLVIRDHTGAVQAVHEKTNPDPIADLISSLTVESAVEIKGKVVANEKVKLGQLEIVIDQIEVVNLAPAQLPIEENSGLDLRLDWRFLDLRRQRNHLIFQVQTLIEYAMRNTGRKMNL